MSEAGKYLENYRKHGSLPFANTDGDYLASKKELISLLEQYHKTQTKKDMPSDEEKQRNDSCECIKPIIDSKLYCAVCSKDIQ